MLSLSHYKEISLKIPLQQPDKHLFIDLKVGAGISHQEVPYVVIYPFHKQVSARGFKLFEASYPHLLLKFTFRDEKGFCRQSTFISLESIKLYLRFVLETKSPRIHALSEGHKANLLALLQFDIEGQILESFSEQELPRRVVEKQNTSALVEQLKQELNMALSEKEAKQKELDAMREEKDFLQKTLEEIKTSIDKAQQTLFLSFLETPQNDLRINQQD